MRLVVVSERQRIYFKDIREDVDNRLNGLKKEWESFKKK